MKKYLATAILLLTIVINSKAQVELNSGGTGAAYTLSVPGSFSLRNGIQVTFKAHDNSAVGATIDVNVTGAISIMKDGGTNALSASDIKAGQIVTLVFDGSNWQMMNPVATPPAAPTTYWSPNGSDIYNNNGGNVTVNADNSDGAYKMAIGKNASSVEKVLALTNTNNFVGGGTTFGFRSNFGGTLWDQASISGITGALSASGDLAFSVMQNRGTSTMIEAMRIKGNTGRIGIMTPNPDRTLHVLGDGLKIENAGTNLEIYPNGNEFMISTTKQYLSFAGNGGATAMYMDDGNITVNLPLTIQDGSQASGRVLASDASGNASWTDLSVLSSGSTAWTRSAGNIYPTTISDKVGIGNTSPTTSLQIHSTSGSGNLRLTSASTGATASDGFSISNDGTTNLFMTQHENADWYFSTNGGTTAMTIKPTGNVGIGTSSPTLYKLHVESSTNRRSGYFFNNLSAANIVNDEIMGIYAGAMGTGASDKIGGFFETSGGTGKNYGVYGQAMGGTTNWAGYFASGNVYIQNKIRIGSSTTTPTEVIHVSTTDSDIDLETYSTTESSSLHIKRGRGTVAAPSIPSSGDYYGGVGFQAWDGTAFQEGARIQGVVDGTPSGTSMPGRIEFFTTPVGSNTAVERMEINNAGNVAIGSGALATTDLYVTRYASNIGASNNTIYANRPGVSGNATGGGTSWAASDVAIRGQNTYGNNYTAGVAGYSYLADYTGVFTAGVIGINLSNAGIYGALAYRDNTIDYAGYFSGNVRVTGNHQIVGALSKGSGTFKIDHPLDPQNKYLYHSFVESPDMMNIYNGNITTNSLGIAEVTLPNYFEALNMEFRYQLTVIGDFAQAIIIEKVNGNKFKIKTDKPNIEVSWQVTGVRKDPFANKNRVVPEVEKEAEYKGKYLHPEAYGVSLERGIGYQKNEFVPKEK